MANEKKDDGKKDEPKNKEVNIQNGNPTGDSGTSSAGENKPSTVENVVTMDMFNDMQQKMNAFMSNVTSSIEKIADAQNVIIESSTLRDTATAGDDNDDMDDEDYNMLNLILD